MWGQALNLYFRKKFFPPLKIGRWKTSNFADIWPARRQSEARNFETAEPIDKQKYVFRLR